MKQFRRILTLTGGVACIVIFWLAPGVNKAKSSEYTRVYEDTYAKAIPVVEKDTMKLKVVSGSKVHGVAQEKKYLKETIKADAKLEDIEPEMFSRAIHFHEHEMIEEVFALEDSVLLLDQEALDSTQLASTDTLKLEY